MSTKIYYAYRVPHKMFSTEFLPAFRKHIFMAAADSTRRFMDNMPVPDLKLVWALSKKTSFKQLPFKTWKDVPKNRLGVVFRHMADKSKGSLRDIYCLDCSLNLWLHKGWMYCILYGERYLWRDFKPPVGVEDYCYWNNTDEPEGVTRRQWKAREKTWEEICLKDGGWDTTRMVHDVIHASQKLGLIELGRLVLNNEDDVWSATWLINP